MVFRVLQVFLTAAAILVLYGARIYLLPEGSLPDYDTVQNWQVAQEISEGNFTNLFFHRSPFFNLFYGFLAGLVPDLKHLIWINAGFNTVAVFGLCYLVFCRLQLSWFLFPVVLLVCGLSVFMVHTSRYLTVESFGLPFFALFLRAYLIRSETKKQSAFLWAVFWLGIGITINYKFLLLLPVLVVLELCQKNNFLIKKSVLKSLALLALPAILFSAFGWVLGLPVYKYAATYHGIIKFNEANPALRTGKFQWDISFYFRYLFTFESPLAWASLVLYFIVFRPWAYLRKQKNLSVADCLVVISLCFVAGMSVLLKAPRGLVFAYVPLYLLGFICLQQLLKGKTMALCLILALSAVFSLWQVKKFVYDFSKTSYPEMAAAIQKAGIRNIAQTVGNGLVPFQGKYQFITTPVVLPADLSSFSAKPGRFLITDTYYITANIKHFGSLAENPALVEFYSPALLSPLFFLEHAEFTGLGYTQTMQLREQAMAAKYQLRLLKLP